MPYQSEEGLTVFFIGEPECSRLAYKSKTNEIQNFKEIIASCDASSPFQDAEFPHDDTSVGGLDLFDTASQNYLSYKDDGWDGTIAWIRAKEYIASQANPERVTSDGEPSTADWANAEPVFVAEGLSRMDVNQGQVGDCWFVSALSEVVMDKRIANFIVPDDNTSNNDSGAYHFRFWYRGLWIDVVVDDYLPVMRMNGGNITLLGNGLKPVNGKVELWANLAEKAYAKLNGSYNSIDGNQPRYAFEALTGGIGEYINLENDKPPAELFEYLEATLCKRSFVVFWTSDDSPHQKDGESKGLLYSHAYAVSGTARVHDNNGSEIKLVRFRNPHGCSEWTGKWSDQSSSGNRFSSAWNTVSQDEKEAIGLVAKDEGEFYMSYKDAIKYFYQIDICYWIPPKEMNQPGSRTTMLTFHGSWSKADNTAGGQSEIYNNPQYTVDLEDDSGKDVTMIISILFKAGLKDEQPSLGVVVYPVTDTTLTAPFDDTFFDETEPIPNPNEGESVDTQVLTNAVGYVLPPGKYVIVPFLYDATKEEDAENEVETDYNEEDAGDYEKSAGDTAEATGNGEETETAITEGSFCLRVLIQKRMA